MAAWRDPCAVRPGETSTDGESGATFGRCGSSGNRGASRAAVSSAWRDPCAVCSGETSTDGVSGATFGGGVVFGIVVKCGKNGYAERCVYVIICEFLKV